MTPPIDLEPLREEIEQRFATHTYQQLIEWLTDKHGIIVAKTTLKRRFKEWGLFHREAALTPTALESISFLFHTTTDNDDDIAATLTAQGIPISTRQVKRARLSQGWRRRNRLAEQQEEQRRTTTEAVTNALASGGRNYGRNYMSTALRLEGHRARFDDIAHELQRQDPDSASRRKPGKGNRQRRAEFINPGPDHLWCIDGHDKLVPWGIHIYAAIDAFSRKINWVYVGNANRARIAVARQYLQTVDALDWCPRFIRADKGQEAVLLGDAHLRLFLDHRHVLGDDQSTLDTLPVADCFFFGASSANQRIENWWLRLRCGQLEWWIVYFRYLESNGFFVAGQLSDTIVLLFVFMPIIRQEVHQFVQIWNDHPIRKQRGLANHVPGIPNKLYDQRLSSGERFGFQPNREILDKLLHHTDDFDYDAYLAPNTVTWLEQQLQDILHQIGNISRIESSDFRQGKTPIVPNYYRILLTRARQHSGLQLAPKPSPENGLGWNELAVTQLVMEAMDNGAHSGEVTP
jgi:hypothetical protein